MKKTRLDRQQDLIMWLLKPFVALWMRFDVGRKVVVKDGFKLNRKQPYIMLANHTFLFDVIHVPLRLKKAPFIIASRVLFKKHPTKFFVKQVAHVIPKAKGETDLGAVRGIIRAIKRGYPVLIFPEGNTTFYGETGYIELSTMKLIKKLGVDVITCNVKGGYLSRPRWATGKRKNRKILLTYELTIPKEKLDQYNVDQINEIIKKALYHNDYDYQKKVMIPHPGKELAKGLENVVYICPFCQGVNTIETSGNEIICNKCEKQGYIDQFGLINNFRFDNLVEWNQYQKGFSKQLKQSVIQSSGVMYYMDIVHDSLALVGEINLKYENFAFHISGSHDEVILVKKIENAIITLRRDFGFTYEDRHFLIKLDAFGSSLLRVVQDKY